MERYVIFGVISSVIIAVSWRTLFNLKSHGFYRFLSWECIAWLIATNYRFWVTDPFALNQIVSWILLLMSIALLVPGIAMMVNKGKQGKSRNDGTLYRFEQTTELIETGVFKYIRHPLYSSLLFLTWGILFKALSVELLAVSLLSTLCLFLTAIFEEKECMVFFGERYKEYMTRTKRFIPFIV